MTRWSPLLATTETVSHLLKRVGSTTLRLPSAQRRNSFHSSLRVNGTANIGIASQGLDASAQQEWYPSLHANHS